MTEPDVPSQSTGEKLANQIRASIQSGEFAPGQRLVERKLAETYGVSHIPVREAFRALAEEGLIERSLNRGARVVSLTEKDLEEISSLRTLLEQFVVVRAQLHWTDEREARLRSIVEEMVVAAKRADTAPLFQLDQRFHELLWEYADHQLLLNISSQLRNRISGFLLAANSALGPNDQLAHAHSHGALVDAVASMDPDVASQAMKDHIASALERIVHTANLQSTND
jgi:DNA-binding GntR family transcriptional regulator